MNDLNHKKVYEMNQLTIKYSLCLHLLLLHGLLIIMHPNLENLPFHSHLRTKLLDLLLIMLLDPPPQLLRKLRHLLLLLLIELGPKPLSRRRGARPRSPLLQPPSAVIRLEHVEIFAR